MAGTKEGGQKSAITTKQRYGKDYHSVIGRLGGEALVPTKGFGSNRKLASEVGRKGGLNGKRRKSGFTMHSSEAHGTN